MYMGPPQENHFYGTSVTLLADSHGLFTNTAILDHDSLLCFNPGSVFDTPITCMQATSNGGMKSG
jgi:hypothetical protein